MRYDLLLESSGLLLLLVIISLDEDYVVWLQRWQHACTVRVVVVHLVGFFRILVDSTTVSVVVISGLRRFGKTDTLVRS